MQMYLSKIKRILKLFNYNVFFKKVEQIKIINKKDVYKRKLRNLILNEKLNLDKTLKFLSHFITLNNSGMNLNQTLKFLEKDYCFVTKTIVEEIGSGGTLSTAFSNTLSLTKSEINLIKVGEETGNINEIVERLLTFKTKTNRLKKKIISSLIYPIIMLIVIICYFLFLLLFVIPMMSSLIKELNVKESSLFFLDSFSVLIKNNITLSLTCILLILFISIIIGVKLDLIRKMLLGKKYKIYTEIFFVIEMYIQLESGINILEALDYIGTTESKEISKDLQEGKNLGESIKKNKFSMNLVSYISLNEESGSLSNAFKQFLESEIIGINDTIERRIKFIEPIMLLISGVSVAITVISTMSPLIESFSKIRG